VLCQITGAYIEEQVLDYADTEFLRDFFDDDGEGTIDAFGNQNRGVIDSQGGKTNQNRETSHAENLLAESFSFEVSFDEQVPRETGCREKERHRPEEE